jgi:hypothetical protein
LEVGVTALVPDVVEQLRAALGLWEAGFNVLPALPGTKKPIGEWKRWQTEQVVERDVREWFGSRHRNLWVAAGPVSKLVVLDCDSEAAIEQWRERLGDVLDRTARVQTSKGQHFWFRLPEGVGAADDRNGEDWTLRRRGGVVAPPSVHKSGHVYEWVEGHGLDSLQDAPAVLLDDPCEASSGPGTGLNRTGRGEGRSRLADELARPAVEGDRDNQLTRVAGHLAKLVPHHDAYAELLTLFARTQQPPLEVEQVHKVANSIWRRERGGTGDAARERKVQDELERLQVREEARARLREASFEPPEPLTFAELVAKPRPDVTWSVEELAERGHNVLLAAQYKAGKTTLALNLARALVDGRPFLGRFRTGLQGTFVWLNYELTELDAQAWLSQMQFLHPERAVVLGLRGRPNLLGSPHGVAWLVELLQEVGAGSLLIDTFRASFSGDSSNDNVQVGRYTALLDEIKQRSGVSDLLLTHHFGRKEHQPGAEHGLGAVELDGWADSRWLLTLDGQDRFLRVDGRVGGLEESRLRYDPTHRTLTLPDAAVGVSRSESKEERAEQAVLLAVRVQPGVGAQELVRRARSRGGGATKDVEHAVKRLVGDGRVVVKQVPGNAKPHYLADHPEVAQQELT